MQVLSRPGQRCARRSSSRPPPAGPPEVPRRPRFRRDRAAVLVLTAAALSALLLAHRVESVFWLELIVLAAGFAAARLLLAGGRGRAASGSTRDTPLPPRAGEEPAIESLDEVAAHRDRLATLGELACGIAHELNNPLAAVCGIADLLQEREDLEHGVREQVRTLHSQADRCRRLVVNLLRLARRQAPQHEPLDLDQVVRRALELTEGSLRSAGIGVVFDPARDLPAALADEFEIQQVLANILTNAVHALAPRGTGLVRIQTGFSPRGEVIVRVTDNGPGMSPEILARIFDPFFTTKGTAGTGLGLSLSRAIVERHGGRLTAESQPGKGTTFEVALPVARRVRKPDAAPDPADGTMRRVLIVDDEPIIVDLLAQLLVGEGHRVITCTGGQEALERLAREPVDVVLSDLCMPDMGGAELHDRIRSRWPDLARRTAFITGDLLNPDLAALGAATGCPLIAKPFQRAEIRRVLAELDARSRTPGPVSPAR